MRYCERKLSRIAREWKVKEAMAATPSKRQIKKLKDKCLTESALKIWHEIGGTKRNSRYVEIKKKLEIIQLWETGFGVEKGDKWIPIENLTTKMTYDIIIQKRSTIKTYIPNQAHLTIYKIDQFLTPEE